MRKVVVGIVQLNSKPNNINYNLNKALKLTEEAAKNGAKLIALPELFAHEYFPMEDFNKKYFDYAQPLNGSIITSFQNLAKQLKVNVVVPWFEVETPSVFYNSAAVINSEGEIIGVHRKTHIPAIKSKEKLYFSPGERLEIFKIDNASVGLILCYERSFPEIARVITLKGAELLLIPSCTWRKHLWKEELQVRAFENALFVIGINRTEISNINKPTKEKLFGNSLIIDPAGNILLEAGDEEGTYVMSLDLDKVYQRRQDYMVFNDRKTHLYGPISNKIDP